MSLPRISPDHWSAVVVSGELVAMGSGLTSRAFPRPAELLHNRGQFLNMTMRALNFPAEATVLVPDWPREQADAEAAAAGWTVATTTTAATAWRTYTRPTGHTLHVGALDVIAMADPSFWLLGHHPGAAAAKLGRYQAATGTAYRATPGVVGSAMIRGMADVASEAKKTRSGLPTGQPYWRYDKHPMHLDGGGDLRWRPSDLGNLLAGGGYVHQFDVRWMYLAAASVAHLAWSPLEHTGPALFDQHAAGYWQVRADDVPSLHHGRPFVVDARRVGPDGLVWLTTPTMVYLNEKGVNPEVVDSWTCAQSGRYLRAWAERLRDGLVAAQADDPDVYAVLRETYTQTIGMMARPGGSLYRPDWAATIIDTARANILRKIDKCRQALGVLPLRVYTDSLYYRSDEFNIGAFADALQISTNPTNPGKLRHIKTLTAAAFADQLAPATRRRKRATAIDAAERVAK